MEPSIIKTRVPLRGPSSSLKYNNLANQILHDIHRLVYKMETHEKEIEDNLQEQLQFTTEHQSRIIALESKSLAIMSSIQGSE